MATTKVPRSRASATVKTVAGEPVGHWAKVLTETRAKGKAVDPFEVTEDLVIYPPTPERARQMQAGTMSVQAAIAAAANAVRMGATQQELDEIQKQIDAGDTVYLEGLIGKESLPLVDAFFADKGDWEKKLFFEAVKKQFLQLPDDDDEESAGKGPASSTS